MFPVMKPEVTTNAPLTNASLIKEDSGGFKENFKKEEIEKSDLSSY
jgi:hypothetical protein